MKIYTRTGDDGSTALFSGTRVSKDSSAIEAYGTVDELNSWLGFCLASLAGPEFREIKSDLLQVQHDLHVLCADLATPFESKTKIERLTSARAERLEAAIDRYQTELAPLAQFILAGGHESSARLHIARTVCRRAERLTVSDSHQRQVNPETITYLNRLSDYLFVAARLANRRAGVSDVPWDQSR